MSDFVSFLFFTSLVFLIVGLNRPGVFKKLFKGRVLDRKFIFKVFGIPTLIFLVLISASAEPVLVNNSVNNIDKSAVETIAEIASGAEIVLTQEAGLVDAAIDSPFVEPNTSIASVSYLVTQVVDGDTIKILMNNQTETIRLIGIDTPETVDPRKPVQCFGQEASDRAKDILLGQKVILEADVTQGERDKYGRLLRYVFLEDGRLFNKLMISEGYAHEYTYNSNPYKYQLKFQEAERGARENQRGLWAESTCSGDTNQTSETTPTPVPVPASAPALEADYSSGPQVKKSTSGICHEKGSTYYDRTTNYRAFSSIEDCLASGGRLPKR